MTVAPTPAPPVVAAAAGAPVLPDAPGKAEMMRICTSCHGTETFDSSRMTRDQWKAEVDNMVARGAQGSASEIQAVVDYLAKYLGKPAR